MARSLVLAVALLPTLVASTGCCTAISYDTLQSERFRLRIDAVKRVTRASVEAGPGLTLYVVKESPESNEVLAASLDGQDREGRPRTLTKSSTATLPLSSTPVIVTGASPGTFVGQSGGWWRHFVVTSETVFAIERSAEVPPSWRERGSVGPTPEFIRGALANAVLVSVEVPADRDEWQLRVSVPPPGGRRLEETPEGPIPAPGDMETKLFRIDGPTGAHGPGPTIEFVALLPLTLTVDLVSVVLAPVIVPFVLLDEGVRGALNIQPKGHCMP